MGVRPAFRLLQEAMLATNSAQEAWFKSAVGRAMNPDGAYGLQCVDVADDYCQAIFGSWQNTIGGGNAAQLFRNSASLWAIGYTGSNYPERGDIIIWGATGGNPYGHIAVVTSANQNSVTVIQQNYNNGGAANTPATHDVMKYDGAGYGRCVGWLRPRVSGATTPNPSELVLTGDGGASGAVAFHREANQRWATASCDVLAEPRPGARKTGHINAGDLVTMEGYVLGEWTVAADEGSSFWFIVKSKGTGGSGPSASGMDWDKLCMLEASGNWHCNTGNGFCGGLQFLPSTWREFGGTKYAPCAHMATREQQIEIGEAVLAGQGVMAWPNTGPKCMGSGGGGSAPTASEDLNGYAAFGNFNPLETYGVPDKTAYDTWKVSVPDPPKLDANAPEAHWDGNTWVGWQWNDSRTEVVWVAPGGAVYNTSGTLSSGNGHHSALTTFPESVPTTGPVRPGDVSDAMRNYLLHLGWGEVPGDLSLLSVSYKEMQPQGHNTAAEAAWTWLRVHNWRGIPSDREERLYSPNHPRYGETVVVTPPTPTKYIPILPGSDVTDHVARLLVRAGWQYVNRYGSNNWIDAPENL